ncbi:MAG TPA: MFS transporter [Candidatus Limnocylindria bacterium]|nr:MFS transporter [Candidatus Limnocylindria bacterium]
MPSLLPDISPLRVSREFRLLWTGQLISQMGSAVRLVAVPYQVYVLTGSTLAVGLLGLFSAVPLIALSLWGGVIADRVDRRRMLLVTNAGLALTSLALAASTQAGLASVPLLYLLTAVGSGIGALDQPARSALAPGLVERRLIPAAMALQQAQFQVASVVGPAIAGLLIAQLGLSSAYWIDVATFVVAIGAISLMRVRRSSEVVVHAPPLRALADGMAFLWSRPLLLATMSVDFFATFFAVSRAVMPYYADRVFAVGPEGLGLLFAAPGAGATVIALTSGWTGGVRRKGLGILVSVAIFGVAIAAFGLLPANGFVAGLLLLAIAQGADTVSAIFRHTILQLETPDALRGRLSALNLVFVAGGPQLGQVESGVVAALWSPEAAVVTGGLACVGVVFFAHALVPQVARYRAELSAAA